MIRHHPADATLLGSAAGTLLPLHRQVVAIHLAQCPQCRAALQTGEEIGGALLEAMPETALSDHALDHALARLDAPARAAPKRAEFTRAGLENLIATGRWRMVGMGIKMMPLVSRDSTGTRLDLIRVAPGTAMPQHGHTGPEIACILHGGYTDETGDYNAGDIAEGDVGLEHRPRALANEGCICLSATTGYLRARNPIARILQPLFGV